ncbi:hypothetical protein ACLKA7_008044 [Drosophila subpalustris]
MKTDSSDATDAAKVDTTSSSSAPIVANAAAVAAIAAVVADVAAIAHRLSLRLLLPAVWWHKTITSLVISCSTFCVAKQPSAILDAGQNADQLTAVSTFQHLPGSFEFYAKLKRVFMLKLFAAPDERTILVIALCARQWGNAVNRYLATVVELLAMLAVHGFSSFLALLNADFGNIVAGEQKAMLLQLFGAFGKAFPAATQKLQTHTELKHNGDGARGEAMGGGGSWQE